MGGAEPWLNEVLLFLYIPAGVLILEGADLKRKRWVPAALALLLAANLYALGALGLSRYARLYPLLGLLPLLLTTLLFSRYRGFKALFVFLTAVIWASPLLLGAHLAVLLLGTGFPVKLLSYIALGLPMLLVLRFFFRDPLRYLLDNYPRGWALFCAVPLVCTLTSFWQTRYRFIYDPQAFRTTGPWQLSLSAISFLSYLLITRFSRQIRQRLEAEAAFQLLDLQNRSALLHIAALKQSQRQEAVCVHDLRHHLRVIRSLAGEDRREEILRYTAQIEQGMLETAPRAFCRNEAANLVLSYFAAQAERAGTTLSVRAEVPEKPGIPDADLCAILSNALENALRAAGAVEDRPRLVSFRSHVKNGQLFLEIANPFTGELQIEEGAVRGARGREGLGTRSIALIAQKHGGLCSFGAQDGSFTLRVILPCPGE